MFHIRIALLLVPRVVWVLICLTVSHCLPLSVLPPSPNRIKACSNFLLLLLLLLPPPMTLSSQSLHFKHINNEKCVCSLKSHRLSMYLIHSTWSLLSPITPFTRCRRNQFGPNCSYWKWQFGTY